MSESRLGLFGLDALDFTADCLFDEGLSTIGKRLVFLRIVERDVGVLEDIVSSQPHSDEVSEDRGAGIPYLSSRVDAIHQLVISHLALSDVCSHCRHGIGNSPHLHKSTLPLTHLQTTASAQPSQSYNTLGAIDATSRSESFLENAPGNVPGDGLELARFAQATMRTHGWKPHKDSGSTVYEPTADVGVAA